MEFTEQTWWFLNATATGKTETAKRAVRSRGCGEIRTLIFFMSDTKRNNVSCKLQASGFASTVAESRI